MPIRLNLLAEVQAAEEIRRRDPVKRVIWIAALLVCLTLVWWSSLLLKAIMARSEIGRIEGTIASKTNDYQMALNNQKKIADVAQKQASLLQLATNRFLYGNLLDALQKITLPDLRLTHFRVDQAFAFTEGGKSRTDGGRTIPGRPATVTEKITLTIDAKDSSPNPGDLLIAHFRDTIATNDYFRVFLGGSNQVRLTKYSPPVAMPGDPTYVTFTVQCASPEVIR